MNFSQTVNHFFLSFFFFYIKSKELEALSLTKEIGRVPNSGRYTFVKPGRHALKHRVTATLSPEAGRYSVNVYLSKIYDNYVGRRKLLM